MAVLTNTMMQGTAAFEEDTGFKIEKGLRVDPSNYLRREFSSDGNRRAWTYSAWYKHSEPGVLYKLFRAYKDDNNQGYLHIESDHKIGWDNRLSGTWSTSTATDAKFRDPSAWFHVTFVYDSSNAVEADRMRLFINGVRYNGTWEDAPNCTQHLQSEFNRGGYNHDIASGNGYVANVQFVDGLVLSPAAFGEFDSKGVWNPKEFARPAPNQNITWTPSSGGPTNPSNMFNGDLSNYAQLDNSAGTKTITTQELTVNNSLRVKIGSNSGYYYDWTINGVPYRVPTSSGAGWYDVPIPVPLTITSFTGAFGPSSGDYIYGWEVDGVILVDGQTDQDTYPCGVNDDGTKYSDYWSGTPSWNSNYEGEKAFDGTADLTSGGTGAYTTDSTATWQPPTPIPVKHTLRVLFQKNGSGGTATVNGTDVSGSTAEPGVWITIAGATQLTSVVHSGSSNANWLKAIEVDGHILTDNSGANRCHLKFNDTTSNAALGYDSLGTDFTESQTATGGPILKTDKSGQVLTSGTNTDPDSSNLKVAIANSATDSSSAGLTITFNGNATNSTAESKFYGSSIKLDGTGDTITTSGTPWSANGNATFECWVYKTTGDSEVLWDTTSQGSLTIMSSGKIELHPVGSNYQESYLTVPQNKWTHIAFTQTSSARRLWINGNESTWGSANGSPQTAAWTGSGNGVRIGSGASHGSFSDLTGYIQDIRIYDKVKYTANFTPPNRNDFTAINLTGYINPALTNKQLQWTGNATDDRAITGVGFQPDLVWIKESGSTGDHHLFDAVRGANKPLRANEADAEGSTSDELKSFTSDGFTLGTGGDVNASGTETTAFCFKAGGTGSTNSNGATSATVSVNTEGTFSIVQWENPSGSTTVGHGLSSTPTMIITKWVDGSNNWQVYHHEMGSDGKLYLNTVDSEVSSSMWGSGPTSTVFTIDDSNTGTWIAYCFTDGVNIKTGSYTDPSGDVTISTDFKPEFALFKCFSGSSSQEWIMKARILGTSGYLHAHNSDAEASGRNVTFNSDNVVVASGQGPTNYGGRGYVFLVVGSPLDDFKLDSLTDSPSSYGTDAGAGGQVRSNFCTWNPLDIQKNSGNYTLSEGNLYYGGNNDAWTKIRSTMSFTTGKWYFEVTIDSDGYGNATGNTNNAIGIGTVSYKGISNPNSDGGAEAYFGDNGWYHAGFPGTWTNSGSKLLAGDVIGVAFDCDARSITWYKNGSQVATASSLWTAGTEVAPVNTSYYRAQGGMHTNFGQRAFKYTAPSGYKALCAANVDDTFSGDELNDPSKYFDVRLWEGNSTNNHHVVGDAEFKPDLIWVKNRDYTDGMVVHDSARGMTTQTLYGHLTDAQYNQTNRITAYDDKGFKVGWPSADDVNESGQSYVSWFWDAGTAANSSTNTDGDNITVAVGKQWVNATAGFSVTQYAGDGSGSANNDSGDAVGHGLNAAPDFVIIKKIDGVNGWPVYHSGLANSTDHLNFQTDGAIDAGNYCYPTDPTNTKVDLGNNPEVNGTGNNYVMYCWTSIPGYSKFGTYEGNGSTDGPMILTGFRPAFVLYKNADTAGRNWFVHDSTRSPTNGGVKYLIPNASYTEGTNIGGDLDILSNGFKWRTSNNDQNNSGDTFIYACFAEHPFKLARAR